MAAVHNQSWLSPPHTNACVHQAPSRAFPPAATTDVKPIVIDTRRTHQCEKNKPK